MAAAEGAEVARPDTIIISATTMVREIFRTVAVLFVVELVGSSGYEPERPESEGFPNQQLLE